MTASHCNTPQNHLTLSAELRCVINERNMLTTRTRMKVLSALDDISNNAAEQRRNTLRSRAIQEIFTSEASYLHQLEVIMTYFMKPMKEKNLVDFTTYTTMFGNIETIYNVNGELLKELKQNPENVASAFLKLAPFFKFYSVYAYDYKQILVALQEAMKVSCELTTFIETQETRPEVGTKLLSLLITPIQRVPRYRLLLKEVLAHTASSHADHTILQSSLAEVERAAEHINRLVQDQENMQKMIEVQRRLCGEIPRIVAPGRKLIKEGVLMKVSPQGRKAHPRHFLLFTDMLMYCKQARVDALRCCCTLPLKDCHVDMILCKDMFRLSCHTETLILYSAEHEEGEKWVDAIKHAQKQLVESRLTLRKDSSSRRPMRPPEFLKTFSLEDLTSKANRKRKRVRRDVEDVYECDESKATTFNKCPSSLFKFKDRRPWKKIKLSMFNRKAKLPQKQEMRDSLFPLRSSLKKSGFVPRVAVYDEPIQGQTNMGFDLIEPHPASGSEQASEQATTQENNWPASQLRKMKLFVSDLGRSIYSHWFRPVTSRPGD